MKLLPLTIGLLIINLTQHLVYPRPTKPEDIRASRIFLYDEIWERYKDNRAEREALKELLDYTKNLDNLVVPSNIAIYFSDKRIKLLGDTNEFFPKSSGVYQKHFDYIIYPIDGGACFTPPTYSCYSVSSIWSNNYWAISKIK